MVVDDGLRDWLHRLPKVEIHLHLEGAIPYEALWELVQKYGGDSTCPNMEALRQRFQFKDFPHFIETWIWKNRFLREYDDFSFIAEAVARDLAQQNIRYVEAFYSPGDFARHGLGVQGLTEAIRAGLNRVPSIQVQLVADLIRDFGPEQAAVTLEAVNEVRGEGVVGIGIGGSEHAHPPEPFADVYARARQLGFRTSAHAGEAAGAESVWGAIRSLRVDRIGHGTRAAEDAALVGHLAESRLPIELNPISNVRTGVVPSIAQHPAKRYFDAGLLVSVNTDDPKMFHNSLVDEYEQLHHQLGISRADILQLILNGIESAWLLTEQKDKLRQQFEQDPAWSEADRA